MNGHKVVRDEDLARRLVVRRGVDGHRTYDESAKRELIERCLERGTSIAKMAQAYGVNANQLHNWIALYRKGRCELPAREPLADGPALSAFIPVVAAPAEKSAGLKLTIRFGNGVQADLTELSREDVLAILPTLPCSASIQR
jgi:transposase-like protein